MDDRVAIFRRLIARYWQPLVSLGAAVPAVLNVLKLAQDSGVGISVEKLPGVAATPQQTYLRIAIFAIIFIMPILSGRGTSGAFKASPCPRNAEVIPEP
ncbi:hypothetical protein IIA29_08685, partial [candidate division KSB1 bacterium]|nr:hypothetical protein [candidate division KSB1 bacterium]